MKVYKKSVGEYKIGDVIQTDKNKNPIYNVSIEPDKATLKCKLITKGNIKFITLGSVLGFENNKVYKPGNHLSENKINITDLVLINVECSIANGSYVAGERTNIIYSFTANSVPPGYLYNKKVNQVIYFPISTKCISDITFKITDQNGNLIDFNEEKISLHLHLKQV